METKVYTVDEVKERRTKLCKTMASMFLEFEKETHVEISGIEFERDALDNSFISKVNIELKI